MWVSGDLDILGVVEARGWDGQILMCNPSLGPLISLSVAYQKKLR